MLYFIKVLITILYAFSGEQVSGEKLVESKLK